MDKSAIRNFSIEARKILMKSAETEAGFYGVTRKGCKSPIQKGNDFEVYETLAGTENRIYGADIKKRSNLVEAVETLGFDQVIEETAYTWFNRIIAIRFMEVNGYLPTRVRVLSSETGSNTPDIVTQSLDVDLNMTPEELEKVQKAKDENRYDDAFRMLFVKQCNELNAILPGLFEKTDDYMELLLKLSYTSDGVVRMLVDTVAEDNFNVETEGQVEIIGWMYQYYNTELKDDTFAKLKKNVKITKERIPAATQLFTPDWIVRYMVENSVGRVWIEHLRAIDSSIDEKAKAEEFGWKYYLPEAEQDTEVQENLVEIRKSYLSLEPKDITCIDPCMGSGHILVYMFDVLMDIYRSEGFSERDASFSILENNIRGIDIDRRAYQLSYFALMMKARGQNRLFFKGIQGDGGERRFVQPLVVAIEESNDIKRQHIPYLGIGLNENEKSKATIQMVGLVDAMVDAKEYGSIISFENYDWTLLRTICQSESLNGQISFETFGVEETKKKLLKLIEIGSLLTSKYKVVVTNPPYMNSSGMSEKLASLVKKNYPDTKTDLSTVFMEKGLGMCEKQGVLSMINIPVWMNLASCEKFRRTLIEKYLLLNMIHFGRGVFGSDFGSTAFVFSTNKIDSYKAEYRRLFIKQGAVDTVEQKEKYFFEKVGCFYVSQDNYVDIPGAAFTYQLSKTTFNHFLKDDTISMYGSAKQGLITGDNDTFLRLWYEVDFNNFTDKCHNREQTKINGIRWYPYNKGGDYRKWYGNFMYVVDWSNDGHTIKNLKNEKGKLKSRPQNMDYYFRCGLTWTALTAGKFSIRYSPEGYLFDAMGPICFFDDKEKEKYVLAFLNTSVGEMFLRILCPNLKFDQKPLENVPLIIDREQEINTLVEKNIELAKSDWDSNETSWNFTKSPLITHEVISIKQEYDLWRKKCKVRFEQLRENEEKLNHIFAEIYNLENEVNLSVDPDDVSIMQAELGRDMRNFISYAVGCMFGRYSLEQEGIVYAGGRWEDFEYKGFTPDSDGIIPITDEEYFKDDIVSYFEDFVRVAFGDEKLDENLDFIAKSLGNKGITSKEKIRNYFVNDFFKDHCNMYSVTGSGKRPIYWLFDSGKENGFKCLIYMHRYTKDTLNLIRSEYLRKTEDAVENALKNIEYIIQTSTSAVEKAKATKDRDKYVKQINEMRIYYQALSHLAIQKIEIDLDDGVKNNYQLFQGIEVIVDGGKKQKVDLLAKI